MGSPTVVEAHSGSDRFWDTYSRYYDSIYRLFPYREMLWDVFTTLELEPGMRVLDAGCGTANVERFIAEKDHPPIQVDAVDFSASMLERARANCSHLDFVTFTQGDLNGRLPFEDSTFDRIVSINVLYALDDQAAVLAEWLRVLKPGGKIVIANPDTGIQLAATRGRSLPSHPQHLGLRAQGEGRRDHHRDSPDERHRSDRSERSRDQPPRRPGRVPLDDRRRVRRPARTPAVPGSRLFPSRHQRWPARACWPPPARWPPRSGEQKRS